MTRINDTGGTVAASGGLLTISTGATVLQNAGLLEALDGVQQVSSPIINTGLIRANAGSVDLVSTIGEAGHLDVDAGGRLTVGGTIDRSATVSFTSGPGTLEIVTPSVFAATIGGFGPAGAIDLSGVAHSDGDRATLAADNLLHVVTERGTYDLQLAPGQSFLGDTFHLSTDGVHGSLLSVSTALCFCAGTLIRTPSGERPVEKLAVGDMVTTWRGEHRPIVWIGIGQVSTRRGQRDAATPVILRKGALRDNVPQRT